MDRNWRRLRIGILLTDATAVYGTYIACAGILFGVERVQSDGDLWPLYALMSGAVALLTAIVGWQHGIYRKTALFGGHEVYSRLVVVATYGPVAVMVLSYVGGGPPLVSRRWLMGSWLGAIVSVWLMRLLWRQVALRLRARGYFLRRVLIAGANRHAMAVATQLHDPTRHGTCVVGFLDDYQRPGTEVLPGLHVVDHPGNVLEQARALNADEVVIIAGALAWESYQLLAEMVTRPDAPIDARISPTFYDLLTTSAELTQVAYVPMLTLHRTRLSQLDASLKGSLDRAVAALLLVALTPAWVYWRVKAWWLGVPMLMREAVLGLSAQPFDVLGLNREVAKSPVTRRLPALWNVLRRDLSIVGPRPIHVEEVSSHDRWLANLFAMRPGLTGFWRLRGADLPLEERVALDLYYIRNYAPNLDVQILVNTFKQLVLLWFGADSGLARWSDQPGPIAAPPRRDNAAAPSVPSATEPAAAPQAESPVARQ